MTVKQAFAFGVLTRCAHEGLGPDAIRERVEQIRGLSKSGILGSALGAMQSLGRFAIPLAATVPIAGGAGLGLLAANLEDDQFDAADARLDETLAEYRRALDEIRQAARSRDAERVA